MRSPGWNLRCSSFISITPCICRCALAVLFTYRRNEPGRNRGLSRPGGDVRRFRRTHTSIRFCSKMRKNPLENDFELELCRLGDYRADDASGQESRRRPPISATLRESVSREEARLSHAFEHEVADGSALAAEPSGAGVTQVSGRMCERVEAVPLGALLVAEALELGEVLRALARELLPQDDLHHAVPPHPVVELPVLVVEAVHESHVWSPSNRIGNGYRNDVLGRYPCKDGNVISPSKMDRTFFSARGRLA